MRICLIFRQAAQTIVGAGLLASALASHAMNAGLRQTTVPGAEPIPVALFYPTTAAAQPENLGGVWRGDVALGGPVAPTLKGLILLSHGTGGSEMGHHQLATRLAQEGYLVAAIRHPGDNWEDQSMVASPRYFTERPAQASRVLDALLTDAQWASKIPAGRIGALGHSAGGFTVLSLAGGTSGVNAATAHCQTAKDDAYFCGVTKRAQPVPGSTAADTPVAPATQLNRSVRDERIRAFVAMAPMAVVLSPESMAQIKQPVRIYVAGKDEVLNGQYHGRFAAKHIPGAELVEVASAGHFAFMSTAQMDISSDAGNPNANPAGFDRTAYLIKLQQELVDYFNTQLK